MKFRLFLLVTPNSKVSFDKILSSANYISVKPHVIAQNTLRKSCYSVILLLLSLKKEYNFFNLALTYQKKKKTKIQLFW